MITGAAADWRTPHAYAPLAGCDRAMLAWEWLRRDTDYRRAAADGKGVGAKRFGLLRFERPDIGVPQARPMWSADTDPAVLRAVAVSEKGQGAFDPDRLRLLSTLHRDPAGEHMLVSDGYQALRLDIDAGAIAGEPVHLRWHMAGLEDLTPRLDALHRLIHCHRCGRFGAPTQPTRARVRRWMALLRVRDALLDRATTREIAEAFDGAGIAGSHWRVAFAASRARAQRLMANARRLAADGPAAILAGC